MRNLIILLSLLFISSNIFSANVTIEKAEIVALNFYNNKTENSNNSIELSNKFTQYNNEGIPIFHCFNFGNNQGFVIVSAEDKTKPIIGYSLKGNYDKNNIPTQLSYLYKQYENQIIKSKELKAKSSIPHPLWEEYSKNRFKEKSNNTFVNPLLTTIWRQNNFYNDSCPVDSATYYDNRVLAGCVAVALGQVIHYNKYPSQGVGYNSYISKKYGRLHADFENTTYNYNNMPNELKSTNTDLAQFLYHCGISVNMNYGTYGSSAYTHDAVNALKKHFNYSDGVASLYRDYYTDETWKNLLKKELNNSRPIIYSGHDTDFGHAFICDGYDEDDLFHFVWGWGGYHDGFYSIDLLTPDVHEFLYGHNAIVGIIPKSNNYNLNYLYNSESKISNKDTFNTSSTQEWVIMPYAADSINISFTKFDTEKDGDILYIYNGFDENSKLIGAYSGNNIPDNISIESKAVFLKYITNETVNSDGWEIEYTSKTPSFCGGTKVLNDKEGEFTDGSNEYNYLNGMDCKWLITNDDAIFIKLLFKEFNTEKDYDSVCIYDGKTTNDSLLLVLQGDTLISDTIFSTGNSLLVHFITDEGLGMPGWKAQYFIKLKENIENELLIYPNPAESEIGINLNEVNKKNLKIELINSSGNIIKSYLYEDSNKINISNLKKGLYFIRTINDEEIRYGKFVVR